MRSYLVKIPNQKNVEVKKMIKLSSNKQLNKVAKSALAMVLAGSFTFGASRVFADGTTPSQNNNLPTVNLQSGTTTTSSNTTGTDATSTTPTNSATTGTTSTSADTTGTTNTDATGTSTTGTNGTSTTSTDTTGATTSDTNSVDQTQNQQTPSLLPGDFFYFAKIALEKIQLAFTFDDMKEAKLLSDFASERLAEAQALFQKGNQDEAIKTIQSALENMKDANNITDQKDNSSDEVKNNDQSDNQKSDDTKTNDQASQGQVNTNDPAPQTNGTATTDEGLKDVNDALAHNIVALKAALEHVKNPVARAALEKNIEKSYAKLAKKLAKLESKLMKDDQTENKNPEQNQNPTDQNNTTTSTTQTAPTSTTSTTNVTTESNSSTKIQAVQKKVTSDVKEPTHVKISHHENNKEVKSVHKDLEEMNGSHEQKTEVKKSHEDNQGENDNADNNEGNHHSNGNHNRD